jgi:hypothetical protein
MDTQTIEIATYIKNQIKFLSKLSKKLKNTNRNNQRLYGKLILNYMRKHEYTEFDEYEIKHACTFKKDTGLKEQIERYEKGIKPLPFGKEESKEYARKCLGLDEWNSWWLLINEYVLGNHLTALHILYNKVRGKTPHVPYKKEEEYDKLVSKIMEGMAKAFKETEDAS